MRIKLFFTLGVMGIAVISGIIKGLSSHRIAAKKEVEEEPRDKDVCLCKKAEI